MDETLETLRRTIGRLTNDVLLKRWEQGAFTGAGLRVAEEEIARRRLDTSDAAIAAIHHRDAALEHGLVVRRRKQLRNRIVAAVIVVVLLAVGAKLLGLT